MDATEKNSKALGSRKWRVLAASTLVMMLDYGFLYALGTLFIPLLEKFQESRVKVAAIQSTFNGVTFISSTLTGLFVNKWGISYGILASSILMPSGFFLSFFAKSVFHLYATVGVIAGLGNSFVFVSCTMAVGKAFPENQRAIALSAQMTLMGMTNIVYPYFLDWLSYMYGVSGAFLIMSGLFLNTLVAAIVFRFESMDTTLAERKLKLNRKSDKYVETTNKEKEDKNLHHIGLCSWHFYLFSAGTAMVIGTSTIFITVAQDIFLEKGFSKSEILLGFLTFNICNTVSRLTPGIFSKLNLGCFAVSLLSAVVGLSGQLMVLLSNSHLPIIVGSGLTGAALGGYACSVVSAVFELLGPGRQAIGLGIIVTVNGITVTAFGPTFGGIRDATGRYIDVLIVAASLNLVCLILNLTVFLLNFVRKRKLERK